MNVNPSYSFPEASFFDVRYARASIDNVLKALESGYCGGMSPFLVKAESILESRLGRSVLLVTNGTIALEAALRLAGLQPGDRVVVPARSFVATVNAVLSIGARPVFVGLTPDGLAICPHALDAVLAENSDIRLVIAAHLYGYAPTLPELMGICQRRGCVLVEDAAQGFGESSNDRPLGTWGKFGTFSFFSNKVVACGEGGAVLCETCSDRDRLVEMRYHGARIGDDGEFYPNSYGSNWRMNALSAAVLCSSLENADLAINARRIVAENYAECLVPLADRLSLACVPLGRPLSLWCAVVLRPEGCLWEMEKAKVIALSLRQRGVAARVGMSWLPNLQHLAKFECVEVVPANERGVELLLPIHPGMDSMSVCRVVRKLADVINEL